MKKFIFSFIVFFIFSLFLQADQADNKFQLANKLYLQKDYTNAGILYHKLLKEKYKTAEIYFNLGNCYYKSENWAPAILYYEKAKLLAPSDKDIELNLKMANLKIIDKIETVPQVFFIKWYNSLKASINSSTWAWISVIFFWLALIAICGFLFFKTARAKRLNFAFALISLLFTIFSIVIATDTFISENKHDTAIIFEYNVYVKSSPENDGKNLFIIHSGTKVKIEDKVANWYKIKLQNGNEGWLESKVLRRI